jgi:hypothetical protein
MMKENEDYRKKVVIVLEMDRLLRMLVRRKMQRLRCKTNT